ncbi:hypothetical protein ASF32_23630 [Methylobacterium sp. Leaf91]|nr:hypothetical protein ASF32_23630 [Methylobacterium sp. Leaf91]
MFGTPVEVQAAIKRFITKSNGDPKPFVWSADPDNVIQVAKRGHQVLDSHHYRPRFGELGTAIASGYQTEDKEH